MHFLERAAAAVWIVCIYIGSLFLLSLSRENCRRRLCAHSARDIYKYKVVGIIIARVEQHIYIRD